MRPVENLVETLHAHRHPHTIHRDAHQQAGWQIRFAFAVQHGLGSVQFLAIQTVIVLLWIMVNVAAFAFRWDPYPFILLNLMFSTQAAYAAPLLQMSNNFQSQTDHAFAVNQYEQGKETHEMAAMLLELQREQMKLLELVNALHAQTTDASGPSS